MTEKKQRSRTRYPCRFVACERLRFFRYALRAHVRMTCERYAGGPKPIRILGAVPANGALPKKGKSLRGGPSTSLGMTKKRSGDRARLVAFAAPSPARHDCRAASERQSRHATSPTEKRGRGSFGFCFHKRFRSEYLQWRPAHPS